jgi:hypothetical protein
VRRTPATLTDDDLRRAAVVIVNDVPVMPSLADRLAAFVERGGGLFVALGPRSAWPEARLSVLPAGPSSPVDLSRGDTARVGTLEYDHPVFEAFRAPRSGDFATAQFFGYRSVASGSPDTAGDRARVLARFDTGAPALLETSSGRGRVLLWTSTLDLSWNDLPLKPVFLPFVHRAVRHLAAYAAPALWHTVGQVVDPSSARAQGAEEVERVALAPSGGRIPLDDEGGGVLELDEQGFYEIRGRTSDAPARVIASNVDLVESDLTPADPRELAAAAVGGAGAAGSAEAMPQTPEVQERGQRLWWYLLWGGLILLGAESFLAARLSKTA